MNDMPIKIETGPYEHNADGIWFNIAPEMTIRCTSEVPS